MSIKYKIFIPIFLMIFTISVSLVYFGSIHIKKDIKRISIEHIHSLGHIAKERIEQYLKQTEEQVVTFNSRVLLGKTLKDYIYNPSREKVNAVDKILKSSSLNNGTIENIIILDTKGKIVASKNNNITKNNFSSSMFDKSKNGIYSCLSFADNKKTPILSIGVPIFSNSIFVGVSVFKIKIDYLNEILQQRVGLGKTGETLLGIFDKHKNIILFSPLRFSKSALIISSSQINQAIPMRHILKNKSDKEIMENELDYRDIPVISSLHYFKPLKIGIVSKRDVEEVMEPIYDLLEELIMAFIAGFIILVIISFIISKYITNIINKIVNTTLSISQGDIYKRVELVTEDELGILSSSINKMADSLVKLNETLEDRVQKQTIKLKTLNSKLQNIFDITPNITLLTDGKTILKVNNQFYKFTGYESLEDFQKVYDCICDMFLDRSGYLKPIVDGLSWMEYVVSNKERVHKAIIEKDGEEYLFLVNGAKYYEYNKPYFIVVFENITELQKVAFIDHLTKLVNRLKIDEILERCDNSFKRYKNIYSVIMLDIDNFKLVNDAHGHLVGDDILKNIAIVLNENTRNIDLVGRWGGEEFLIISKEANIHGASKLAEKIRKAVESYKFEIATHQTVSIGVAQVKDGETIDELLRRADDALYEAKDNGKNRVVVSST